MGCPPVTQNAESVVVRDVWDRSSKRWSPTAGQGREREREFVCARGRASESERESERERERDRERKGDFPAKAGCVPS